MKMATKETRAVPSDRIMVKNPNTGRDDTTIAREMYEPVRQAILEALAKREVPFSELRTEVSDRTPKTLWENASIGWYTTTVKLDIEARGLISRKGSPQILLLTAEGRKALGE
jgi:hypothetical protein